jgi:hypothetical protein
MINFQYRRDWRKTLRYIDSRDRKIITKKADVDTADINMKQCLYIDRITATGQNVTCKETGNLLKYKKMNGISK